MYLEYLKELIMNKTHQLYEIKEKCKNCKKCKSYETRKNIVFSSGNEDANVMFIGEAPGEHEDNQALPFVGPAGQLLESFFQRLKIDRNKDLYISNVLKCRPIKIGKTGRVSNRTPDYDEMDNCIENLIEQIKIVNPKLIVLAGSTALKALTKRKTCKIKSEMGQFFDLTIGDCIYKAIAVLHPSYLMQYATDDDKVKTLEYLKKIKEFI